MSWEVHIEWQGATHFVGRMHAAEHGPAVSFEYATEWLKRDGAFAIDPTSLPLRPGLHHLRTLFGAMLDCGPDRWAGFSSNGRCEKRFWCKSHIVTLITCWRWTTAPGWVR